MWERLLYEELEGVVIPSGKDAMRIYVEEVLRLEHLYGCEFYFCRQLSLKNLPPDVYLGINSYGVTLFNKKKEMLRKYRLEGIFRWGYQPNSTFYFEIKSSEDAGSILEFETNDGEKMSKLLTDYALAFLQERDRDRLRAMSMLTSHFTRLLVLRVHISFGLLVRSVCRRSQRADGLVCSGRR